MKILFVFVLFLRFGAALFAESFDSIAKEMLSNDVRASLRGANVAINTAPDAVSAAFAEAFQNAVKKTAVVVFMDRNITKKELQRQESGVVDDKEVARYGYEKGAEIVIQLILYRIPRSTKIKFIMRAAWVESNTLAASNVVIKSIPSSYNVSVLPIQGESPADTVKNMTNTIVSSKVKGIYNDPVKPPLPPKPPKPPRKPIKLPEIDLTNGAWMGGNISALVYSANNTNKNYDEQITDLFFVKFTFEYGRDCSSWNIKDRWCSEISLLIGTGFGLDFNVGYQVLPVKDHTAFLSGKWYRFIFDNLLRYSCTVSAGFSIVSENDISPFIPYIQLSGHILIYHASLRLLPFTPNAWLGVQIGLGLKCSF